MRNTGTAMMAKDAAICSLEDTHFRCPTYLDTIPNRAINPNKAKGKETNTKPAAILL
jgi:hypothetical protein